MSETNQNREATFYVAIGVATRNKPHRASGEFFWFEERISIQWHGRFKVYCDKLEDIHAGMISFGLYDDAYEVFDKDNRNVLYQSPIVIEYVEDQKTKRENQKKKAEARLKDFNELPLVIKEWQFGVVTIKLTRTKGVFNRDSGYRIRSDIEYEVYHKGVLLPDEHIMPRNYITSDGKVQAKKFRREMRRGVVAEHVEYILPKLKEMFTAHKEFYSYWVRRR